MQSEGDRALRGMPGVLLALGAALVVLSVAGSAHRLLKIDGSHQAADEALVVDDPDEKKAWLAVG